MTNKRKLDDLIESFEHLGFEQKAVQSKTAIIPYPPAKRGHCLPIEISKLNIKPCRELIRFKQMHKFKNIFGLPQIPDKEQFTKEEVEILIDQRERMLYKQYLDYLSVTNLKEKIVKSVPTVT